MNEFRVEQQPVTPANFLICVHVCACVRAHLASSVYCLLVANVCFQCSLAHAAEEIH